MKVKKYLLCIVLCAFASDADCNTTSPLLPALNRNSNKNYYREYNKQRLIGDWIVAGRYSGNIARECESLYVNIGVKNNKVVFTGRCYVGDAMIKTIVANGYITKRNGKLAINGDYLPLRYYSIVSGSDDHVLLINKRKNRLWFLQKKHNTCQLFSELRKLRINRSEIRVLKY